MTNARLELAAFGKRNEIDGVAAAVGSAISARSATVLELVVGVFVLLSVFDATSAGLEAA